jgi:hypothetical protein
VRLDGVARLEQTWTYVGHSVDNEGVEVTFRTGSHPSDFRLLAVIWCPEEHSPLWDLIEPDKVKVAFQHKTMDRQETYSCDAR